MSNKSKDIASQVTSSKNSSFERSTSDKIDGIVAQKWLGILVFALVMYVVFFISQVLIGPIVADFFVGEIIEPFMETVEGWLEGVHPVLSGLIVEGILGGIGAVIGFLPLIMVLFFLLALLEDSGYMARVAVVLDRFFKKVGLTGKSIIPMYVSTGCAVPGIMASKTIKNEKQKRTTVLLSPFIPCGAKAPVYLMIFSLLAIGTGWIAALGTLAVYAFSLLMILVAGYIIKAFTGASFKDDESASLFIELPDYKLPSLKKATFDMLGEVKEFVYRAATILIIANAIVWFMSSFTWTMAEAGLDDSMLASISRPIAFLMIPLGFGIWQLASAAIAGFVAKEEVVGVLAIVFASTFAVDGDFDVLSEGAGAGAIGLTTTSALLAFMVFNLYTPPCFAAIGAMKSQLKNKRTLFFGILLQFAVGYLSALLVYQIGHIIEVGSLGEGFIPALFILAGFICLFIYMKKLGDEGRGLARIDD